MLRPSENETEILLGNKQLLGIFLVVAVLLGVAFTGGYLLGHGGSGKKTSAAETASLANDTAPSQTGTAVLAGQTHTLGGEPALPAVASGGADAEAASSRPQPELGEEMPRDREPVLGSHKRAATSVPGNAREEATSEPVSKTRAADGGYTPHTGTRYLQVTALARDHAEAIANVLYKKGFSAHAVPTPGNDKLYRVIVGPVKDAGELSSTRDALRKTGFREVIVQHY